MDITEIKTNKKDNNPLEHLEQQETLELIIKEIDNLPEKFKKPLTLFSLSNMPYKTISETLKIPIGTVKTRLAKARSLLESNIYAKVA